MVLLQLQDVLSCAMEEHGGPSAVTFGTTLMLVCSVNKWAIHLLVNIINDVHCESYSCTISLLHL